MKQLSFMLTLSITLIGMIGCQTTSTLDTQTSGVESVNTSVAPFLMFEGKANDAIELYMSLFPESRILSMEKHGPDGPGPEGTIFVAWIELAGMKLGFSDSYIEHGFTFTPSTSLFVTCASQSEIETLSQALSEGGEFLMPLGDYGFSTQFAWVVDQFGVSWQLNLE